MRYNNPNPNPFLKENTTEFNIDFCQAQPKVQLKASAFGWDGYNIIIIQPPTRPDKYEGDEIEQILENESCLSVWVDPKNVFEPCPNLKNSQIRAKNFSISFFLC